MPWSVGSGEERERERENKSVNESNVIFFSKFFINKLLN